MNFKQITLEDEKAAKAKFMEHGQGIEMTPYTMHSINGAATWHDLIDTHKHSENSIIQRMKGVAKDMVISCDDPLLEGSNILFTYTTELDEVVKYSYDDAYLFLRAVLKHRRNTSEYRIKKVEINRLEGFIEANKTLKEKRKDAASKLKELQESL